MAPLLLICGTAAAAFFACLDGWYLLRMPLAYLYARWLLPSISDPLQEQQFHSWVLPSDLDLLVHMNNSRYPREADMARCVYMVRCGLFQAIRALGGHMMLAASCCRFRRSLHLLEHFTIRTRIRGWDHRAFFLEQRFVSARDGFVCAVLLVRQHVTGTSPGTAVEQVCRRKVESPALSEEIQHWVRYNEASSQSLRMESDVQEKSKAPLTGSGVPQRPPSPSSRPGFPSQSIRQDLPSLPRCRYRKERLEWLPLEALQHLQLAPRMEGRGPKGIPAIALRREPWSVAVGGPWHLCRQQDKSISRYPCRAKRRKSLHS